MRVLSHVLFALAVVALAWCGFVVLETRMFQQAENHRLEQVLATRRETGVMTVARLPRMDKGLIGRIEIARLSLSVIVMEGTGNAVLRHAAGHINGTALPGRPGNTGISAHRDTFFRPLRGVQVGDVIIVTTAAGDYRYRVQWTRITNPSDTAVLDAESAETLTLVTCYPFYFVGAAPQRFIVRAKRVT